MLKIINLLNEMKEKKIIQEYGIGEATALIYYFEPIQTQDIDVFVVIESFREISKKTKIKLSMYGT